MVLSPIAHVPRDSNNSGEGRRIRSDAKPAPSTTAAKITYFLRRSHSKPLPESGQPLRRERPARRPTPAEQTRDCLLRMRDLGRAHFPPVGRAGGARRHRRQRKRRGRGQRECQGRCPRCVCTSEEGAGSGGASSAKLARPALCFPVVPTLGVSRVQGTTFRRGERKARGRARVRAKKQRVRHSGRASLQSNYGRLPRRWQRGVSRSGRDGNALKRRQNIFGRVR